jgi:flagellar biosynthesis anti-sigma factor FlgM
VNTDAMGPWVAGGGAAPAPARRGTEAVPPPRQELPPRSGTAPDRVDISGQAGEFRRARERLATLPEGTTARLAALRALVERGAYRVSGPAIADALLGDEAVSRLLGFTPPR